MDRQPDRRFTPFGGSFDLALAARALGGDVSGNSILCPGPGHSSKDRSLSIAFAQDAPDGFVLMSHSGDDWRTCRDHVRARLGLETGKINGHRPITAGRVSYTQDDQQRARIAIAIRMWSEAVDPRGTLAERYLNSRGLALGGDLASSIRFHPSLGYNNERTPAMVALFRDIHTNQPCGLHRTFLDADARKIDRRMIGRAKNAAIKLDADSDVTTALAIGEGIETCLSARQLGYRPVWALGSAPAIEAFPLIEGIEALHILGEHDESGANARAIKACAKTWIEVDREVFVAAPATGDMNDAIGGAR